MKRFYAPCQMIRKGSGTTSVELPICLLILFVLFFFPMLDMAVCGLRATTIQNIARDAARVGGRAATFSSAKQLVLQQANLTATNSLTGATIDTSNIAIDIVVTPVSGGTSTRSTSPLPNGTVDQTANVYQLEVTVPGSVQPLVTLSPGLFGKIPGLTMPMPVKGTCRDFVEHPLGLTQ